MHTLYVPSQKECLVRKDKIFHHSCIIDGIVNVLAKKSTLFYILFIKKKPHAIHTKGYLAARDINKLQE